MKTYIQDWLGSRIGIVIDLSPEHFGRHTKDGTLLAKLLYSYGAIPQQILNNVKASKNVNDCYNNLKVLKPWLEYLEVPVKDEVLYEVASGQGTAALHLFYALYLNLKHQDPFKYLSVQKERRYSHDQNKRDIQVGRVPEKAVLAPQSECESEAAAPLIEKQYMVEWHKKKCDDILQKIRMVRESYSKKLPDTKAELGPVSSRHASSKRLTRQESEIENTEKDLKQFTAKHECYLPDLSYQELIDLQNQVQNISLKQVPDFKEARGYVNFIKQKATKGIITQKFQEEMQTLLIDDLWNNLRNKQDDNFEEIVCQNLLKQSQYEKQMCTKLCLIRRQKDLLVKHRQKIDSLNISNIIQKEYEDSMNFKMEVAAEDAFDIEFERQRLLELHRRVYIEKVRLKFKERLEEAKSILDKFIDIAVRISEFRDVFACEIPKHIMKDLKELFYKDLPVFDILDDMGKLYSMPVCGTENKDFGDDTDDYGEQEQDFGEGLSEETFDEPEKEECVENEEDDMAKAAEFIRQEVLNECDFNDYLFLLGPWMTEILLPDDVETEISQTVLGYIVHKMLACKYPLATVTVPAQIKPMNPRGIVQGSSDDGVFTMLSELLALKKILVVRVDDAINYVLGVYKQEVSNLRESEAAFQQATKIALKGKSATERTKEHNKKEHLIKRESVIQKRVSVEEPSNKEVSTQTPRKIPEDDPLVSPNAEIGKSAFESLGMGDPVPDTTVISAIIAYVVSLQDEYDGWVLWNYPVLYSQAITLESVLTGFEMMDIVEDEMDTIEGIEGFDYRSNYQNVRSEDEFAEKRLSRLVPKPEGNTAPAKAESYFTTFVKIRKKNDSMKSNMHLQGPGKDKIERFYTDQEILHIFEFTSITFENVKDIAKVVLGETYNDNEDGTELNQKTSVELFGDGVLQLNEKYNASKKKIQKDAKKQSDEIQKKDRDLSETVLRLQDLDEKKEDFGTGEEREKMKKTSEFVLKDLRPGDPGWEWATGDQSEETQLTLACFWERIEAIFIEDFKYIFFCLRVHKANTVKFKAFLKRALQNYLRREDIKQNILNDFQHKFNDIDDDLRPDCDVKCELHVRVSELEELLLERADERREKSEKYRIKFINDNWVADELTNLVNQYVRALQLEANRCIDTCQFINDYYLSLQKKVPQDNVLQKIYAPTLLIKKRSYSVLPSLSRSWLTSNAVTQSRSMTMKGSKGSVSRRGKDKGVTGTASRTPCCSFQHEEVLLPESAEAIADIMVNLSFPQDATTPFHVFFIDTAEDLRKNIKHTVETCMSETRKGGPVAQAAAAKDKKKTAETKIEVNGQAAEEWATALESELSRFLYRMRLIQVRGIQDFNEFILEMLNTVASISEEIGEIYNREVASISECCKVFRCAIEEEVAVQPRLELHVDEFTINHGAPLFRSSSVELMTVSTSSYFRNEFTIEQLTFIFWKLQYIAPDGEIIRRAFLYILEDLRVMKSEDGKPRLLPDLWDNLNPNDLPFIFDRVYQRIEIVNWKDFIVYALELPMPTDIEILGMLSSFRSCDPSGTELINLKDFISIEFWFESYSTRFNVFDVKEFLFKMYQVNEEYTNYTALLLAFCKDEDPFIGFVKALTLSIGKRILIDTLDQDLPSEEGEQEEFMEEDDNFTQDTDSVKSARAKENAKNKLYVNYSCDCRTQSQYTTGSRLGEEAGESYGLYFDDKGSVETFFTSDIPRDVIKKVILASYPSLPQLCVLLKCKETFQQTVDNMVDGLSADGVAVKISKLLKHKFIFRILSSTNKFKTVDIQNIVKTIVEERQGNLGTSCSLSWS